MSPERRHESKRSLDSISSSESTRPSKLSASPPVLESSGDEGEEGGREGQGSASMNPRPAGIQRYLIAVEYVGTRFFGSQRQPNCRTVAGVLEEAFRKFVGKPVSLVCSSRTDAGVHALSNVFHVDVERTSIRKPGEVLPPHEPGVVKRAVNHFLQVEGDVMVIDVRGVAADFHARFKAIERTYFYRLLSGPESFSTFDKDRAWHVPENLDIDAMKKACSILVGVHDFSSFRASGCQASSPIKSLDELHIIEVPSSLYFPSLKERNEVKWDNVSLASSTDSEVKPSVECLDTSHMTKGNSLVNGSQGFGCRIGHRCYVVTARGRSFLYHQVRLLVGVLKCVGTGELAVSDVERILLAKTVTAASPMAPACGLYLGNVKYDNL